MRERERKAPWGTGTGRAMGWSGCRKTVRKLEHMSWVLLSGVYNYLRP